MCTLYTLTGAVLAGTGREVLRAQRLAATSSCAEQNPRQPTWSLLHNPITQSMLRAVRRTSESSLSTAHCLGPSIHERASRSATCQTVSRSERHYLQQPRAQMGAIPCEALNPFDNSCQAIPGHQSRIECAAGKVRDSSTWTVHSSDSDA